MSTRQRLLFVVAAIAIGAIAAAIYSEQPARLQRAPLMAAAGEVTTSRGDLEKAMETAERRLAANPADGQAAAAFAQAALRRARIESNGGYTLKAGHLLKTVLDREPGDYDALKMLGAVYMSQHRFREAIEVATRAMRVHPADAWNYGVAGDAHLVFTMDALAWAYYRAGRLADAEAASRQARRTGTVDRRILAHAAAIDKSAATLTRGPDSGTRTPSASL